MTKQKDIDFAPLWKEDWDKAMTAWESWWEGKGLALSVTAPADEPHEIVPDAPNEEDTLEYQWLNIPHRTGASIQGMSKHFYGGTAYPSFNTNIGPGSLGLFLGCKGHLMPETVWYEPVMDDYENHPPLVFDETNEWWPIHVDLVQAGLANSKGRYLTYMPDLIENIDTLGQLRGNETLLYDLIEHPEDVKQRLHEINVAFFECYDRLYAMLEDPWGGSGWCAFGLWGKGKVAKVQCDFCLMMSPKMFGEFVVPPLAEQCAWLDKSMYHLDGTGARMHLDALLAIEHLNAIEWTPEAGLPQGGSPEWYDIYRQIKAAGKGVQAVGVRHNEVEPLLDAVGPEGMCILTHAPSEKEARALLDRVGW